LPALRDRAYAGCGVVGGIMAPMIQKIGRKMPKMNITQCPFRIVAIPSEMSSTSHRNAANPPIAYHMAPPLVIAVGPNLVQR
jgi:hypothetical protein